MNNRRHNIYFHTHTISGIIICAVLYVIFFTGSFSLFYDEIKAWERNQSFTTDIGQAKIDCKAMLDTLDQKYDLTGRDFSVFMGNDNYMAYVYLKETKDTLKNKSPIKNANISYNFYDRSQSTYAEFYGIGEFLFRLHFLSQIDAVPIKIGLPLGRLIAAIVSFIFLFALITGIMLHWNKIISNFFTFRPFSKWKTVWTDVHTALGVIGLPYQLMFAVTGIVLTLNIALTIPYGKLLYVSENELYDELTDHHHAEQAYAFELIDEKFNYAHFENRTKELWPDVRITQFEITNYGDKNMQIAFTGKAAPQNSLAGVGTVEYHVPSGEMLEHHPPNEAVSYATAFEKIFHRLHYGDFGGTPLRIAYFVLGLMSCVVFISGVLIWLVARDKNNIPARKRKFNFWTSNIFVAVCLTMYPVTALSFIVVKLTGLTGILFMYKLYFYSWLALTVFYVARKSLRSTNLETLLLGSILGLLIPVVNGIATGNWIWITFLTDQTDIFIVDMLWILIAAAGFVIYGKIKGKTLI